MRGPVDKPEELPLSKRELEEAQKLFGRVPNELELFMFSAYTKMDDPQCYIRKTVLDSCINKKTELGPKTTCISISETFRLSQNGPLVTYPVLLQMAIRGYRPLAQNITLCTKEYGLIHHKGPYYTMIKSLSKAISVFGLPVMFDKAIIHANVGNELVYAQHTIGLSRINGMSIPGNIREGNILFYAGIPADFDESMNKKAGVAPDTEISPVILNPYKYKILIDFVDDLTSLNLIRWAEAFDNTGLSFAVRNLLLHHPGGIILSFSSSDCLKFAGLKPRLLTPGTEPGVIMVTEKKHLDQINVLCEKWDLHGMTIGQITREEVLKITIDYKPEASIPLNIIKTVTTANNDSPGNEPSGNEIFELDWSTIPEPEDIKAVGLIMMGHPGIITRNTMRRQFDYFIGNVIFNPSLYSEATLFKASTDFFALAFSHDICILNAGQAFEQEMLVRVSRTLKKIICTGALPNAITLSCSGMRLNDEINNMVKKLERAYKIKTYYTVCKEESSHQTPALVAINITGIIKDKRMYTSPNFKQKGDMVYIIGNPINDISSSQYLSLIYGVKKSPPPFFDLEFDSKLISSLKDVIQSDLVQSAHSIQEGGIFMTLVESSIPNNLGFDITSPAEVRTDAFLFGESPLISLVSVTKAKETAFIDLLMEQQMPFYALGHVTREELRIDDISLGFILDYKDKYERII